MADATPAVNMPLVLGCIEIGVILNAFLFGIVVIQFFTYINSEHRDSWTIRAMVWWTCSLDLVHSMISTELLWKYTVSGFGNYTILLTSQWEYTTAPIFICLTSVPIQIYLSLRVKRMAVKPIIGTVFFAMMTTLSITQGILGLYISCSTLVRPLTLEAYSVFINITVAWTSLNLATDLTIALALITTLLRRRTGFKRTDNMIMRIITITVQSAVPVAAFAIGHLTAINLAPSSGVHDMFAIPLGRLYTNTLLVTLNSRSGMHPGTTSQSMSGGLNVVDHSVMNRLKTSERYPVKIHVSQHQQQDIAMDPMESPSNVSVGDDQKAVSF